jgi:hypothetical protein
MKTRDHSETQELGLSELKFSESARGLLAAFRRAPSLRPHFYELKRNLFPDEEFTSHCVRALVFKLVDKNLPCSRSALVTTLRVASMRSQAAYLCASRVQILHPFLPLNIRFLGICRVSRRSDGTKASNLMSAHEPFFTREHLESGMSDLSAAIAGY